MKETLTKMKKMAMVLKFIQTIIYTLVNSLKTKSTEKEYFIGSICQSMILLSIMMEAGGVDCQMGLESTSKQMEITIQGHLKMGLNMGVGHSYLGMEIFIEESI